MSTPWEVLKTDAGLKDKVIAMARQQDQMILFKDHPLLASLLACLGLQFEIGREGFDRFSALLGIEENSDIRRSWQSELIKFNGRIGIRFYNDKVTEFAPRQPELVHYLHPFSISNEQLFNQVVIFPEQIAEYFRQERGIELVIVRDWALSSFLAEEETQAVNYLKANAWEIKTNSAVAQAELMHKRYLCLSGTHDLVDHMLGATAEGLAKNDREVKAIVAKFKQIFARPEQNRNADLVISYLLGLLLDDLAQPRWYGADKHLHMARLCVMAFDELAQIKTDMPEPMMLTRLTDLMTLVRKQPADFYFRIDRVFGDFLSEIKSRMRLAAAV